MKRFLLILPFLLTIGAFRLWGPPSLLVQEAVVNNGCTKTTLVVTCVFPSNVTSGHTMVIGWLVKRGSNSVPVTIADTMNIAGTSGFICPGGAGPDTIQAVSGQICAGFPTSTGPETVTFTTTSGFDLSIANAFVSEWLPNIFSPCQAACTFITGIPNCCVADGPIVPVGTLATTSYGNNFSIAFVYATFTSSCGSQFWTTPVGTAPLLDVTNGFIAYALQPNTLGVHVTETQNCGTGSTGAFVWGGEIFSSVYVPVGGSTRRFSQVQH